MGEDIDVDGIHTERVEPCVSTSEAVHEITKELAGKGQKAAIIHVC